jgi:perosamine synthetase
MTDEDELKEVIESIQSGWITTGPKVKKFENDFAEYVGAKHAIAVNSCTAALHLALEAVGITEGDGVITTPMTFAATAEVIRYFNAKPIFVDIDPITMNIDTAKLEEMLESRYEVRKSGSSAIRSSYLRNFPTSDKMKAIIPVHFGGYPCEMDVLLKLAEQYNLKVIEDAAHVLPAYYKGKPVGSIGDITCFSFYATKNITTGEGGMITTDNDEWAERMRIMSLHGISKDAWKRYTAEGSWYYEIVAPGYKYNMTDIAAAMGLVQLKKAYIFWKRRVEIASMYTEAFKDIDAIETPVSGNESVEWEEDKKLGTYEERNNFSSDFPQFKTSQLHNKTVHSWHLYVIKLNLDRLTIDRNRFIEELKERGIGTSVHFIPLHIHPYYRETYGYKPEDFPVAYETYKRVVSLPLYPKMTDDDVERVITAVKDVIDKHSTKIRN